MRLPKLKREQTGATAATGTAAALAQGPPAQLYALPFPTANTGGGFGPGSGPNDWRVYLPGSTTNWLWEAGPLWRNSVVSICIGLLSRTFPEAPLALYKPPVDGQAEMVTDNPFLDLMDNPNPDYGPDALWAATLLSAEVSGNAYWLKQRDNGNRVRALWYVPHWMMAPRWPMDGSQFISDYGYRVNGKLYSIPKEDVIHFRPYGLDPENPRLGLNRLQAQLRNIVGDNEAGTFMVSLTKNSCVPGLIIRPAANAQTRPPEGFIERLKDLAKLKFSGDRRGEPMALTGPVDVDQVGWSPEQMALDVTQQMYEARICAAMDIPPALVGLRSGADSATFANVEQYDAVFYEKGIIPRKKSYGRDLQAQLYNPDFEGVTQDQARKPKLTVGWDYSHVECLQEDRDAQAKRVTVLVTAGVMTPNEARKEIGLKPITGDPDMDKPVKKLPPVAPGDKAAAPGDKADASKPDASKAAAARAAVFARLTERREHACNGNGAAHV